MQPSHQFSNRPSGKTIFIIVGGIIALCAIGLELVTQKSSTTSTSSASPNLANAPTPRIESSPTVLPKAPNQPTFSGFNNLTDRGVSDNQLSAITYSLTKFNKQSGANASAISVVSKSVSSGPHDPNTGTDTIMFKVSLNSANSPIYQVNVRYFNLTSADTAIINPANGKILFDSGTVDLYTGTGI